MTEDYNLSPDDFFKKFGVPKSFPKDGKPWDPDHDGDAHVPGLPDPDLKDVHDGILGND